ncbi:sulfite exporter TauE/SafE family protein [Proteus vulgaris]|uniref:sulfite exporter TauE/SafE family protein n=1 Tax=Proteus TaxID=583 RepID=UPI000D69E92C|nr:MULTISPECIES: sulfite exporter TauE/SafE family protein [Proteus]MBQ0214263.1 sulfite exporter TauE/SafE family protein [Proteus vulgaris]MDS0790417.1 sulfite exporter TauE/SafE family protein [Proteus vulgaris]
MTLWLISFGLISGITTWLFGFGGGFVTVPLLYTLILTLWGIDSLPAEHAMQIAVATSALIMLFSATVTTIKHHKAKRLDWHIMFILFIGIAFGGILGALLALTVEGTWIKWIFIGYLFVTILDCYFRPGFMAPTHNAKKVTKAQESINGTVIGIIAAFLGVGGSVMTVPLLRRRGTPMAQSAAMANALTLPLALTATFTYVALSFASPLNSESGFIGYIWLKAAFILICSTWIGLKISERFLSRIPDKWHARVYPLLLSLVLIVMLF